MGSDSLYARMRAYGTLAEPAKEVPDAVFALPSTLNWMRGEAILVESSNVDFASARAFYQRVQRKDLSPPQLNSVCEQLLFTLHQIAALAALSSVPNKADVARVGIVAWYYGVYGAASAMIAAADGSFPQTHAATAQQWDRQFAASRLVMVPFADRLTTLVAADIEQELIPIRARGKHPLTAKPTTLEQAWGCHAEYLSGTAKWERWNQEVRLRQRPDFIALGVDDFRTKQARILRDNWLSGRGVGFLHEASRYRGKANYRDAIYLAYGKSVPTLLEGFVEDLQVVLKGFAAMAAGYCATRMGKGDWRTFIQDLEAKRAISISPMALWQ